MPRNLNSPIYRLTIAVALLLPQSPTLFAQESKAKRVTFESYYNQALIYTHQDNFEEALKTLKTAAEVAESKEDQKALLNTYHRYALLFLEHEDKEKTEFYWHRAGIILKKIEYPYGDAMHKFIEASLLKGEGNYYQAINLLEEVKLLSNEKNLLNHILLVEANIYLILGKFKEASTKFNALLINSDDWEQAYLATRANMGLAMMHQKQGNLNDAIKNGEAALALALKNDFRREALRANTFLAAAHEGKGDFKESLAYSKNVTKWKDSVFNTEKSRADQKTANTIHQAQQSKIIDELEQENAELNQSANRSEITAILTSAFLIIISLLAVSLFRNNQIKLKTNDLLHTKNRELESARDAAVSAMKAKTNFLSTVTHELRTPLYAVTGLTHLLLEENPSDHQKEHLKSLKFSGDYLLNFINDILQINKIDADKLEPLNIEFKLKKVLNDVIDSLQQTASENNTRIVLDYDNTIPLQLLGDPLKISQVFMNLVGNALKFTKNGQVDVITKVKHKEDENITLYFEVKDNGIGISEEQQQNIFESFEQGSVQINREYGGTGLGLTIVKSLLGIFDSQIHLRSKLGVGSSFFFDLTLKAKEETSEDAPFELSVDDFDFDGLHILIVEDNKINQVITKKMLNKKNITCDIANNGNEAIDAAMANTYDAILMDIHMPGISGTEATRQIRKFDPDIPIIALTAVSMDDNLDEFYEVGCNTVVTKPFKPEVFYQKIGENIFKAKVGKNS